MEGFYSPDQSRRETAGEASPALRAPCFRRAVEHASVLRFGGVERVGLEF